MFISTQNSACLGSLCCSWGTGMLSCNTFKNMFLNIFLNVCLGSWD